MNSNLIILAATFALSVGTFAAVSPTLKKERATVTADSHLMTASEVETTRRVREMINNDRDLSVRAHNVKIITENGRVFLKGPVASKEEHAALTRIAKDAAQDAKIVNETYVEQ